MIEGGFSLMTPVLPTLIQTGASRKRRPTIKVGQVDGVSLSRNEGGATLEAAEFLGLGSGDRDLEEDSPVEVQAREVVDTDDRRR